MCQDRRHDWDTPDDIEDRDLDDNSSSSDDISNAVRYVPISAGTPVKTSPAKKKEMRYALRIPVEQPAG